MKHLGLIGVGAWGRRYIERIGERSDCEIRAVARASAGQGGVISGAVLCENWQALVRQAVTGELDGLIAATTPLHQADVAATCATQGIPLLVEKPLGLSHKDAERVRSCFEVCGRKAPLIVNYIHLWAAAFVQLKHRVIEAGGANSVRSITTEGFNNGPLRGYSSLYDYGPHDLAMTLEVLGTNAEFCLRDARRIQSENGGELHDVLFDLRSVPVRMRVGNGGDHKARRFAVELRDGRSLVYDDVQANPHKLIENGAPLSLDVGTSALDAVLADFLEQIESWRADCFVSAQSRAILNLSTRINALLDEITARAQIRTG